MSNPLNKYLYDTLVQVFGSVKIANEGEAMTYRYVKSPFDGQTKMEVDFPGEQYRICCPFCSDTRHRLYISHRWGVKDERGFRNTWLLLCFNEGCTNSAENRHELVERVSQIAGNLERASVRKGEVSDETTVEVQPPGYCVPLHELPQSHKANRYLAGRFYDPEHLGRFYRVGYCQDSLYFLAKNRIYVPVFQGGVLKGWQVRMIGETKKGGPPKWWSCPHMKKSRLLYNIDNAKRWHTGVIVEGCGDVWGFGPMATATFGATMSPTQIKLFAREFAERSAVLLFDPDAMDTPTVRRLHDRLSGLVAGGVAMVKLPDGYDPGSMDRAVMRKFVTEQAKSQGVLVRWKQVN